MTIKDGERDYLTETTEELRARVVMYLMYAQVQNNGYQALRSYGIDYQSLPEWKNDAVLQEARKMKPQKASEMVVNWLIRVDTAIAAAIRRKQLVGLNGGRAPDPTPTKH